MEDKSAHTVHTVTTIIENGVEYSYCTKCGYSVYFVPETGDTAVVAAGNEAADHVEA